ncbi:MAG TPA: ABC transporter permease [Candidatus Krumholzibacteriaceae bacterium]
MTRGIAHGVFTGFGAALASGRSARRRPPRHFFGNGTAVYSLMLIALILAVSLLAPLMTPYGRDAIDLGAILAGPSPAHALGTDDLGRDVFTRLIYAGRFSMLVALCSVAIALAVGLVTGTVAGYFGGAVDVAVTMTIDLFLSVPVFLVLLVAASAGGGRLWLVPLVIGGTSWMETARIVRSLVMSLKEESFVQAARAAGARDSSLIVRHVLPQAFPSVIVSATTGFAQAMLVESALSFLGFGVQPPVPTWGNMLENANVFIRQAPLAAFAPGFMIIITCLSFNNIGEGLRRMLALDR